MYRGPVNSGRRFAHELVVGGQNLVRPQEEALTVRREPDAGMAAMQQPQSRGSFEGRELAGERRLGDEQVPAGSADAARGGDCGEGPQLSDVHLRHDYRVRREPSLSTLGA
jgi:hypothetical protein